VQVVGVGRELFPCGEVAAGVVLDELADVDEGLGPPDEADSDVEPPSASCSASSP
jgi:hypothetical protein